MHRINCKKLHYNDALQQGFYPAIFSLIATLSNKIKTREKVVIFQDLTQAVYNYFIREQIFLTDKMTGQPVPKIIHNLQTIQILLETGITKDKDELFNYLLFLLVHNLPPQEAKKALESISISYAERFEEYRNKRVAADHDLLFNSNTQDNSDRTIYFNRLKQEYFTTRKPFDPEKILKYQNLFNDCFVTLREIVISENCTDIDKARFLQSRHKNTPDILILLLIDTLAGTRHLTIEDMPETANGYLTLKFLSLLIGHHEEMYTRRQHMLEKVFVKELQDAYTLLERTEQEATLMQRLLEEDGINYFDLQEIGKNFLKNELLPYLSDQVKQGHIDADAVFSIDFRVKALNRYMQKFGKDRNLEDLVGYKIICKDAESAYQVSSRLNCELLSSGYDHTKTSDNILLPRPSGYRALHCTYHKILPGQLVNRDNQNTPPKILSIEIQYVGGKDVNLVNQRSEKSGYLTTYAASVVNDLTQDDLPAEVIKALSLDPEKSKKILETIFEFLPNRKLRLKYKVSDAIKIIKRWSAAEPAKAVKVPKTAKKQSILAKQKNSPVWMKGTTPSSINPLLTMPVKDKLIDLVQISQRANLEDDLIYIGQSEHLFSDPVPARKNIKNQSGGFFVNMTTFAYEGTDAPEIYDLLIQLMEQNKKSIDELPNRLSVYRHTSRGLSSASFSEKINPGDAIVFKSDKPFNDSMRAALQRKINLRRDYLFQRYRNVINQHDQV